MAKKLLTKVIVALLLLSMMLALAVSCGEAETTTKKPPKPPVTQGPSDTEEPDDTTTPETTTLPHVQVAYPAQLEGIKEGDGIVVGVGEYVLDLFEPFVEFASAIVARRVFPVGSQSMLRELVHTFGAYLYFKPLAVVAHDSDVQCLIAIGLRHGYPVANTLRVWTVDLGDG